MFEEIYEALIAGGAYNTILKGLWITLKISFFSVILGSVLGAGICALRMSKVKILSITARIYISVLRGSPLTMLLMLLYYCVFASTSLDAIYVAVITFGLSTAAYVAEMLRSAIKAVNRREAEAALTLGFNKLQTLRYVVIPQTMRIAKPVYQSTIINMIQWTSVVGYVTITDLTRVINNISSRTMQPLLLIVTGIILYILIAYVVSGIFALTDMLNAKKRQGGN
ncbi:MAG: ABC transporter permease subunit [Phascolarctobacterium sp.]|nr:ABC transporter permease subunit [Candidatus Phascolarctobacterium caballi]